MESSAISETDLDQFFDFSTAGQPVVEDAPVNNYECPSHSGTGKDCICHGFIGEFDEPQDTAPQAHREDLNAADYARHEDWIPRFVKPDVACEYCRAKHLSCYLTFGKVTCTACDSLFRPCSFANADYHQHVDHPEHDHSLCVDTLHPLQEDVCQEQGTLTGVRPLRSKAFSKGTRSDDSSRAQKTTNRFSRAAVKIMRDWLDTHLSRPYPSDEEKVELETSTGLKPAQIATWLANARRRNKSAKSSRRGSLSGSPNTSSEALAIPGPSNTTTWSELNPFERWQHSPPENEPAPMEAIADAVAESEFLQDDLTSPSTLGYRGVGSSSGSALSAKRAPSTTSLETSGQTSSQSAASSAAWSGSHDSLGSFGSFGSGLHGKKDRRRRRKSGRPSFVKVDGAKKRIFQCTFCTDTFRSKYDWSRHEKTLHLSLEKWLCAPLGPVVTDPATGAKTCVYCRAPDPSQKHIEQHAHVTCEAKGREARTFFRKDHLRQHLRLVHNNELLPHMDSWKVTVNNIVSRCGFCAQRFVLWQDRVDHLAGHFKEGAQMSEWKGCRGLDPEVAAHVLNAMPPYLIGMESRTPNPFSATTRDPWYECLASAQGVFAGLDAEGKLDSEQAKNEASCRIEVLGNARSMASIASNNTRATCWEILTVRLGQYAKQQADKGITLTDEMLQCHARSIIYSTDDAWNQTAADNPEWLDLFKKAHGLDYIPSNVGGMGLQVPEDLEIYGDLGLRVPFSVQLASGAPLADRPAAVAENISHSSKERLEDLRKAGAAALQRSDTRPASRPMGTRKRIEELKSGRRTRYQSYSSLVLPKEKARQFATVTGPKLSSGVLGPTLNSTDYLAALDESGDQSVAPAMLSSMPETANSTSAFDTSLWDGDLPLPQQSESIIPSFYFGDQTLSSPGAQHSEPSQPSSNTSASQSLGHMPGHSNGRLDTAQETLFRDRALAELAPEQAAGLIELLAQYEQTSPSASTPSSSSTSQRQLPQQPPNPSFYTDEESMAALHQLNTDLMLQAKREAAQRVATQSLPVAAGLSALTSQESLNMNESEKRFATEGTYLPFNSQVPKDTLVDTNMDMDMNMDMDIDIDSALNSIDDFDFNAINFGDFEGADGADAMNL